MMYSMNVLYGVMLLIVSVLPFPAVFCRLSPSSHDMPVQEESDAHNVLQAWRLGKQVQGHGHLHEQVFKEDRFSPSHLESAFGVLIWHLIITNKTIEHILKHRRTQVSRRSLFLGRNNVLT